MIFVTVGNDFRGFERLLRKVDEMAPRIAAEMVIQRGSSTYLPKNAKHFDFVSMDEAIGYMRRSELVVSHAGIGTIILCKEYGIPILILPRRKKHGEHMNDHQLEVAKALESREEENIYVVTQEDALEEKILKILKEKGSLPQTKNPGRVNLIRVLRAFVETLPV